MATMNPEKPTKTLRVVVANEPLCYREVISCALDEFRPDTEVVTVGPDELDPAVLRLRPQAVFCNRASPVVEEHALVWAELYPDGNTVSEMSISNERSSVLDMQLEDLFALLERAVGLARRN